MFSEIAIRNGNISGSLHSINNPVLTTPHRHMIHQYSRSTKYRNTISIDLCPLSNVVHHVSDHPTIAYHNVVNAQSVNDHVFHHSLSQCRECADRGSHVIHSVNDHVFHHSLSQCRECADRGSHVIHNNQPHTLVVIILRLGKAKLCIPALYLQFEDNVVDLLLALSEGLLNMKYKESLLMSYKGFIHDIFTQILRGLSGSEVTKPGMFRSSQYAVESSLQAEVGLMYPAYTA
ncbi:hypothetical protein MTR67_010839 [Solanum verrucosum]|uniref:FACT complex subunit SSRP1-like first PH domain-containing protein n=1 Tax=Solanum verrucosum TaxID=315347 RepID=A0AAF0TG15_SOLVR|nr:hypothetical protein MTR67_010839 [Solanum verrucosum]